MLILHCLYLFPRSRGHSDRARGGGFQVQLGRQVLRVGGAARGTALRANTCGIE
jgi:hypothetical protein